LAEVVEKPRPAAAQVFADVVLNERPTDARYWAEVVEKA
jgi:hypothetical protein